MKHKRITRKDILFFIISIFIVSMAWIGFSLYHAFVSSTISEDLQIQIVPIEPRFDTDTIQKLKLRQRIPPLFEKQISSEAARPSEPPNDSTGAVPTPSITTEPSIGAIVGQ